MKIFIALALIGATFTAFGQQAYLIDVEKSTMELSGETNLSSWDEQVVLFKGSLNASTQGKELKSLTKLELQIPVEGIEAPRKGMQKDTYEALKKDEHPEITFVATEVAIESNSILVSGKLTVAGTAKQVTIQCDYSINGSDILITGSYHILMSDFGVIPPKAMLGTLQVEEMVDINFKLMFRRS